MSTPRAGAAGPSRDGRGRRPWPRWSAGLLVVCLLSGPGTALAQAAGWPALPGLPGLARASAGASAASAASAPAEAAAGGTQELARLASELETVQRLQGQFADGSLAGGAPPEVTPDEAALAGRKLGQWAYAVEGQLRAIAGVEAARAELAAMQSESSARTALPGPPYSILLSDEWARDAAARQSKIAALQAADRVAERDFARLRDAARQAEEAQRRAEETLRGARDAAVAPAEWRARAARWAASADAAALVAVTRDRQWTQAKVALERQGLALAQRRLDAAAGQVVFKPEDLAQVRRTEKAVQARLDKEAAAAQVNADLRARELEAAQRSLQQLRDAPADAPTGRLDVAEAQVRALRTALDTARHDVETLAALNSLSTAVLEMWSLRFDAMNADSADRRRAATASLRALLAGAQVWRDFASGEVSIVRAEMAEQAARQERSGRSPEVLRYELAAEASLRQRALRTQELVDSVDRVDRGLGRWLDEIGDERRRLPWTERAALLWSQVREVARTVWTFELFAVEDTIDIQGQKITVTRGVSVGKSVGAVLLFIVGYLVAASLARRLERTLAQRFGVRPAQARTVRRWALALVAFLLLVVTLNLAQIPLTVFAFLGGALAIGVGFGTQTIIKNFISGLIVLMERQVRVGDIVDVDGMTGTVSEVNLRSSTIRSFDGIDAIVPNSTLLEGRVTNWTMGDHRVRRTVRVGVAYGSDVDDVMARMLACAQSHAQVLQQPAPRVLFEDFGDSTLMFGLYIWLDVGRGVDGPGVMSELRVMIGKSFAEAGISIAFPQRDVHLDTLRPLQVELARRSAAGPPQRGA
jgi:potassium-dependent mechanosensitive channel